MNMLAKKKTKEEGGEEQDRPLRQIRVSEAVYAEIGKLAQPLVDSPEDVLRRVFKLPPRK